PPLGGSGTPPGAAGLKPRVESSEPGDASRDGTGGVRGIRPATSPRPAIVLARGAWAAYHRSMNRPRRVKGGATRGGLVVALPPATTASPSRAVRLGEPTMRSRETTRHGC